MLSDIVGQLSTLQQVVFGIAVLLGGGVLLWNIFRAYTADESPRVGWWVAPSALFGVIGLVMAWLGVDSAAGVVADASGHEAAIAGRAVAEMLLPVGLALLGAVGALIPATFFVTSGDEAADVAPVSQLKFFGGALLLAVGLAAWSYYGVPAVAGFEGRPATSLVDDVLILGGWMVWVGIGLTRAAGCRSAFPRIADVVLIGLFGVVLYYGFLRLSTLAVFGETLGSLSPTRRMEMIGLAGKFHALQTVTLPLVASTGAALMVLGGATAAVFRHGFTLPSARGLGGGLAALLLVGGAGWLVDQKVESFVDQVREELSGPKAQQGAGEAPSEEPSSPKAEGESEAGSDAEKAEAKGQKPARALPMTLSDLSLMSGPALEIGIDGVWFRHADDSTFGDEEVAATRLVSWADGPRPGPTVSDEVLTRLKKRLTAELEEARKKREKLGQKLQPMLMFYVDRTTQASLVNQVLGVALEAGFDRYRIVGSDADELVDKKAGRRRSVEPFAPTDEGGERPLRVVRMQVESAEPSAGEDGEAIHKFRSLQGGSEKTKARPPARRPRGLNLTVYIRSSGFDIGATGATLSPIEGCPDDGPTICLAKPEVSPNELFVKARDEARRRNYDKSARLLEEGVSAYDFAALYRKVAAIKKQYPDASTVRLADPSGFLFALAIRVFDTLRLQRQAAPEATNAELWSAEPERSGRRPTPLLPNAIWRLP